MKTTYQVLKEYQEDNDGHLTPECARAAMKEYAHQFKPEWLAMDQLEESHHGQDLLLIAKEQYPLRADGKTTLFGKYWHDTQKVYINGSYLPVTTFKAFMLTDKLLP